jgi:hypothetical protein
MDAIYDLMMCCVILHNMISKNQQAQNLESLFDGANVAHSKKRFDLTSIHERHTRIREICKSKFGLGTFCKHNNA